MRCRIALFLVAFLAVAQLAAAAPPTAYRGDDDDEDNESYEELDAFVNESVLALNTFWDGTFRQLGHTYVPPKLVQASFDDKIKSKCGNSQGADHSYCPVERTVYVDYDSDDEDSFISRWDSEQALVDVATLGHEWGHHVQNLLGTFDKEDGSTAKSSIRDELQADCLMGAFIRTYARAADWVGKSDIKDVIVTTGEVGDDPAMNRDEMTHGSPEERVAAFQKGFTSTDVRACGIQ